MGVADKKMSFKVGRTPDLIAFDFCNGGVKNKSSILSRITPRPYLYLANYLSGDYIWSISHSCNDHFSVNKRVQL